ncbi:MAG: HNH endonuclease, partial [Pyrinomonadaceae bacterium]
MRTLPKPVDDAGEVFRLCISRIRRRDLKRRLLLIEPNIIDAARTYDVAASSGELYEFPRSEVVGAVTNKEMIAVYVGRMVQKSQPGRSIYDKLM